MKNLVLILISLAALSACGSDAPKKPEMAPEPKVDITANPDYQNGLDLISKSDCLTCHKIGEVLIGPPYKEVAKKYADQADAVSMLAEKIMKGGTGVWGQVPMAAHPDLSKEDAEAMVKYILLLKP